MRKNMRKKGIFIMRGDTMNNAIVVRNLVKSYSKNIVLKNISFSIAQGETFALLGVNGAGKTTTIECIEGLRRFDSGSIAVCGHDVSHDLAPMQKLLGVQLQSTALSETMTAKEAMRLFCAWHHVPYRKDLLERFDMAGAYLNKTYGSLSTGRKRRLHLALALCHNPKVLILDEPTSGLDVEGRYALHEEIRRLKQDGVSILIATHDMAEAEKLCDTIAILRDGVIAKQGTPRELTADVDIQSRVIIKTREGSLINYHDNDLMEPQLLEDEYLSFACPDVAAILLKLLTKIQRSGDSVVDLRVERAGIEDLFIKVAGGKSI